MKSRKRRIVIDVNAMLGCCKHLYAHTTIASDTAACNDLDSMLWGDRHRNGLIDELDLYNFKATLLIPLCRKDYEVLERLIEHCTAIGLQGYPPRLLWGKPHSECGKRYENILQDIINNICKCEVAEAVLCLRDIDANKIRRQCRHLTLKPLGSKCGTATPYYLRHS